MSRLLRGESTTPPPKSLTATPRARAVWTVVMGLGLVVTLIGVADVAIGWFETPLSDQGLFRDAVNRHFFSLLTPTMGLGAVAAGFMGRGSRKVVRVMSWVFGLLAAGHVVLLAIYFSFRPTGPAAPYAALETFLRGGTYAVAYSWVAYYLWIQTRVQGWPSRPG